MTQLQVEEIIGQYLQQSISGAAMENPKLDFKRTWYNLSLDDSKGDFLVDTSAMANTVGLDAFIVIGYDEPTKKFHSAVFAQCGLKDTAELMNIVSKHADPIYTVNSYDIQYQGNSLSVLHIPPSLNKPHQLKSYSRKGKYEEQRIFIRKNSKNMPATRYDLELMYYDRKNIIPDYLVHSSFPASAFHLDAVNAVDSITVFTDLTITFENLGRRGVSIAKVTFDYTIFDDPQSEDKYPILLTPKQPIVVMPGQMVAVQLKNERVFSSHAAVVMKHTMGMLRNQSHLIKNESVNLLLSTGETLVSPLTVGGRTVLTGKTY